jgi:hypothetical protein
MRGAPRATPLVRERASSRLASERTPVTRPHPAIGARIRPNGGRGSCFGCPRTCTLSYPGSVAREMAVEGWRQALVRLRESIHGGPRRPHPDPNVPLAEAIYWLSVIEDDAVTRIGSARYYGHRDSNSDGQTVAALVFARNQVSHELAEPSTQRPTGGYGGSAYGTAPYGGGISWHWKSRTELGSPTDEKWGRDVLYDQLVAGRLLEAPLDAAGRYFDI